jgi:hypothetical protein
MKKENTYCLINALIFAVILNLALPLIAKPMATPDEIKPPNGAHNLDFKGQIMHMLVHHSQVPLTSSIIVGLIVVLAVVLGYQFKPVENILKIIK